MYKGIAVHTDMKYALIRPTGEGQVKKSVLIVAKDRTEALVDIIGPVDIIAELQGNYRTWV